MPTEKDYRRMVNERIGRAVREGSRSRFEENTGAKGVKEDDEFALWLKKAKRDQMQRRQRRMASVAAVFLCLFLGAGLFYHLPADDQAFARHEQSDRVDEQGGSIIIGGDGNGNSAIWTATFTNYEDIPEQYKEKIVWFEELPKGYELKGIKIQKNMDILTTRIEYCKGDNLIQIKEVTGCKKEYADHMVQLKEWNHYERYRDVDVYQKKMEESRMYSFFRNGTLFMVILDGQNEKKGDKTCLQSMINTVT